MGQAASTHEELAHWRISWGPFLSGKKSKEKQGCVCGFPVQGRSQESPHRKVKVSVGGSHVVGNQT